MADNITKNELGQKLWACADVLRTTMEASQYKDYLLGLVFYKALSDRQLYDVVDNLEDRKPESLNEALDIYREAVDTEAKNDLLEQLEYDYQYSIPPEETFTAFMEKIEDQTFMLADLKQALSNIEKGISHLDEDHEVTIAADRLEDAYTGLFKKFNVDDENLGKTPQKRNDTITSIMKKIDALNFNEYGTDALGDAYEYLLSMFASESKNKAGEFYTPQAASEILARIVTMGREDMKGFSTYDPCMGSGSLLIKPRNFMSQDEETLESMRYIGQEIKGDTYGLCRMNMVLHKIKADHCRLSNNDSLDEDWPQTEPTNFDAVVMNPPYSLPWSAKAGFLQDPRFQHYEKLAPKKTADFAFLLHGFYHLKDTGTMGIVLPHGVLFRGAAEGTIRKHLVEDGSIYAVIGLPANIFYNTSIPTCVIILKKNRISRDILFIDGSKEFRKEKASNVMDQEHIDKIVEAYRNRVDIEKFAHVASFEEIKENEYNLNIPRYVDSYEEEEEVDLVSVTDKINEINVELADIDKEILAMMQELTSDDDSLEVILGKMKG